MGMGVGVRQRILAGRYYKYYGYRGYVRWGWGGKDIMGVGKILWGWVNVRWGWDGLVGDGMGWLGL